MDHLEFVDKINETGVSIRATNFEGKRERFVIYDILSNGSNTIILKDFKLQWEDHDVRNPLSELIKIAIDMDTWKHSWHNEITPENYEKFRDIIQNKVIDRANEIKILLTVYFQIGHEISKL